MCIRDSIEGAEVVGICDLYKDWAERNAALVEKKTGKRPPIFTNGPEDYKLSLIHI